MASVTKHAKYLSSDSDSAGRRFRVFCRRVRHAASHRGEWISNERAVEKLDRLWNQTLVMKAPSDRKRVGIEAYLDTVQEEIPTDRLGEGYGSFGHRMKLRRFQYQSSADKVTGFMNSYSIEFDQVDREYGKLVLNRFFHDLAPEQRKAADKSYQKHLDVAWMLGIHVEGPSPILVNP